MIIKKKKKKKWVWTSLSFSHFYVGLLTCFTNTKEWGFTRALGGREWTPTKEPSCYKTPARKGVRMEVCFWGKVIIVLGNLTTVPEERGWWCMDVCGQAPCWQGRVSTVCTRFQPSIMLRPYVHSKHSTTRQRRHMMQWAQVCNRHQRKAAGLCIHKTSFLWSSQGDLQALINSHNAQGW